MATFAVLAFRKPSLFSHPTFIIAVLLLRNLNIDSAISTTATATTTRISRREQQQKHNTCNLHKKKANARKKYRAKKKKIGEPTSQPSKVKSCDQASSPVPLAKRFSEPCNSSRKYKINTHSLIIT